ncbi:MAG: cysteine--tRNA ligase, partial [Actinomycetota bacterium]|nr:cysteine--tRNA ligase [Actinomycetota bacterium]
ARLDRLRAAEGSADPDVLDAVRAALDDDLDTTTALEHLDASAASGRSVREPALLLGVSL